VHGSGYGAHPRIPREPLPRRAQAQPGGAARAPGIAESACRVAIASLTGAGIRESAALAIVPFDLGRVTIARHGRAHPSASAHLFGGATLPLEAIATNGAVTVAAITNAPGGTPVEWIEIRFALTR
jgi:hypothetical protein